VYIFNEDWLIVTRPKYLREVLIDRYDDFKKSDLQARVLFPVVGNGLILADGEEHKVRNPNKPKATYILELVQYPQLIAILTETIRSSVSS
jgi:hypothetical protein